MNEVIEYIGFEEGQNKVIVTRYNPHFELAVLGNEVYRFILKCLMWW